MVSNVDLVAAYAAIVATGALFLEVRRWFESGVRLRLSLMSDAIMIPEEDQDARYLHLTVSNTGDRPTTITHMVLMDFKNPFGRLTSRTVKEALVHNPSRNPTNPGVPWLLEPGTNWVGMIRFDENAELKRMKSNGWLYAGVIANHRKRPFLTKVSTAPKIPEAGA